MSEILFCNNCQKEVFQMSGDVSEEDVQMFKEQFEADGKLLLVNPPVGGPLKCPACGSDLVQK